MLDKLFSFGKNRIVRTALALTTIAGLIVSQLLPGSIVQAAPILTIESITWDVIGLDSNSPASGPRHFPVGARVCNVGSDPTNDPLIVTFEWDDVNDNGYINIRPGTNEALTFPAQAAGDCVDAYFEVEVNPISASYLQTRAYTITATDGTVTATTPSPRQLYVEYLISQNRNATNMIRYGTDPNTLTDVAAGGSMNLYVGGTYYIELDAKTATQGYEQLETFITLSNTVFQILSVETTYSANTSPYLTSPHDQLYADACLWENDPNSPNYLSCLDSSKKSGGIISVLYEVRIIGGGGTTQTLNSLIYDFSGASYHYNSDYSAGVRFATIISASIDKSFSPKLIAPNANPTLTFTVNNPGPSSITDVNFTDLLPLGVTVVPPVTTSQCDGTVTLTTDYNSTGRDRIVFTGGTVAGLSSCTITVTVTSSANGIYNNTTDPLYIGETSTGDTGSDTLVVSSSPPPPNSCVTRTTMATWTFENYAAQADTTLDNGSFNASSTILTNTPQGVYRSAGSSESAIVDRDLTVPTNWTAPSTGNSTTVWGIRQSWLTTDPATPGNPSTFTSPFFEFQVNTEGLYGGLGISLDYNLVSANGWTNSDTWYVLYSADNGATWSQLTPLAPRTGEWAKGDWIPSTTTTTGISAVSTSTSTSVYFRLYFAGAASGGQNANANAYIDNVNITGCAAPPPPTISKSFGTDPLAVGSNSQLTFTIANTGTNATNLTGVSFVDALPDGLELLSPAVSNTCGGTLSLDTAAETIQLTGGTINAAASCTIIVNVQGGAAGSYTNTSTNITSTQTGPNPSATPNVGFARDTIDVIAPPTINKVFGSNFLLTGETTSLTFSISNPNNFTSLTGIAFTDTLPAGVTVADGGAMVCGGGTLTLTSLSTIELTGASLPAGGSCAFSVTVTGATAGDKLNTVTVTSTEGGDGNESQATLLVRDPVASMNFQKQIGLSNLPNGTWFSYLPVEAGTLVYYKFTIENTGDVVLTSVSVVDAALTALGVDLSTCQFASLPVADDDDNQIFTCIVGPVTAIAGEHTNTANATSTEVASETDTATYAIPELTLVKTADQMTFENESDEITYTFTVTNTGSAILSGPITIADDLIPADEITCQNVSDAVQTSPAGLGNGDNFLDPGEQITCEGTYTITAGDVTAGSVTNTATASSTASSGLPAVTSEPDSVIVSALTYAPVLQVVKSGPASAAIGDTITYTFAVSHALTSDNSPATGPLTDLDDIAGAATFVDGDTNTNGDLDAGESWNYSVSYTILASDPDPLVNEVTVSGGSDPDGTTVPDATDTHSLDITYAPILQVAKSGPASAAIGDTITYTFAVSHALTSDNSPVTGPLTVVDDIAGAATFVDGDTNTNGDLDAGETWNYSVSYTILASDPDPLVNEVTVSGGNDPDGTTVPDATDTHSLDITYVPALTIAKTANPTSVSAAGQVITYTIIVTNTGDVALTAVSVSDPMLSDLDCNPLLPGNQTSGLSIPVGGSLTCTGTYTVTVDDINTNGGGDGLIENTATASDSGAGISESDREDVTISPEALIGAAKRVVSTVEVTSGTYDVTYEILVRNYGTVVLNNIQVTDTLAATFPLPTTFEVRSLASDDFTVNGAYNGVSDSNLLGGSDSMAIDASGIITLVVRIVPAEAGPFLNTAIASGQPPAGEPVSDASQNGSDPDPDNDGDPTNNNEPTPVDFGPNIFDPPIGIKVFDDSGLPLLEWTMIWINNSNIVAINARVSDPIPANTSYSATGLSSGYPVPPGAPGGSTNVGVRCYADPTSVTTTTTLCYYEGPTPAYQRGRIIWEGAIGPDLGATDENNANNELYITFRVNVPQETSVVYNVATIDADLDGDGAYDETSEVEVANSLGIWVRSTTTRVQPQQLPATGFAPGTLSALPSQPEGLAYREYSSNNLVLEIPRLNIRQEIVGVPFVNGNWDVTWLNSSIGYLNGTAFPGWIGNTALTGHVYGADGLPGPFVNLAQLKWGDKVILYANGQKYIYEVRVRELVAPDNLTPLSSKDRSWLTLITCKEYDAKTNAYRQRVVVQAVLLTIEPLTTPSQGQQ